MKKLMSAALATGLCFTAASGTVTKCGDIAAERWRGRGSQRYPAMSPDFFTDPRGCRASAYTGFECRRVSQGG